MARAGRTAATEIDAAGAMETNRQRQLVGRGFVLLASLLWSLNGFFAKAPVFATWPNDERGLNLCLWRAVFGGLALAPLIRRPRLTAGYVPLLVCFLLMNVAILQSLSLTTAANAAWLQAMAPLWVCLFGVYWFREPFDPRDRLTLGLGLAGVTIILVFELSQGLGTVGSIVGALLGVVAGIAYAVVVLSLRRLRGEDPAWLVALALLTTAAAVAPYVLFRWGLPTNEQLGVLALFGLLQMGLPYLVFAQAVRRISSQEASGIGLIEPVIVPLWVYLAWGERAAWWTMVGGACIITGLGVRYLRR